jgi:glycosyltransferase involved in cell wall biosynthesis
MRRDVPVACSRASSLPEVAGGAARYFDPYSVADIADAITELLTERDLADDLVSRGRKRQAEFTWEATARGTLESYARAWAQSGRIGTRREGRR